MKRKNSKKKLKQLGQILESNRGNRSLVMVASKMGMSFGYLAKLERGEVERPKIDMFNRLVKFYKLDYDTVLHLADKIPEDVYWKIVDNPSLVQRIRNMEVK